MSDLDNDARRAAYIKAVGGILEKLDIPQVVLDLLDENEALYRDAGRYRWLRDSDRLEGEAFSALNEWLWGSGDFSEVTAAIDAARSGR